MARKIIKTTKKEIADYWQYELEDNQTNVPFSQATSTCWRCGIKKRLDRCHILPESLGGDDTPSNFILLCKHCHFDNPNLNDKEIIWDWLRAYRHDETSFWLSQGKREYEYIYGIQIDDEIKDAHIDSDHYWSQFEETIKTVGHHFGQPRNNRATVAGALRLTLKNCLETRTHEEK